MPPSYVIISGGTGANSIASAFGTNPAFVLPVSDDGGSSSEILRCFGGPSIGDIRSRLNRLIPLPQIAPGDALSVLSPEDEEITAIHELMAYRFPADASEKHVKELWGEIVEGRSSLWDGIGEDKKECIRAFLVHFQTLALRRAHKRFSFRNFSLGNGFLTGARDMFGSLPSAIFLFKSIASVPAGAAVIPVINTNQTVTIAVELENGETIVGQCAISHPTDPPASSVRDAPGGGVGIGEEGVEGGLEGLGIRDGMVGDGSGVGEGDRMPRSSGIGAPGGSSSSSSRPAARTSSMRLRTHFRRDSRTFDTTPMDTPAVSTRTSLELGGRPLLRDLVGPSSPTALDLPESRSASTSYAAKRSFSGRRREEDEPQAGNIGYVKGEEEVPLEARIERLFYINLYGQEIFPSPNPDFLSALSKRDCLVYSCGSLWTSIVPCLALRGLASAIATSSTLQARIVLLNSHNDRETPSFTASDYIRTIVAILGHYDRPRRMEPAASAMRRGSEGFPAASTAAAAAAVAGGVGGHESRLQPCQWEAKRLVSHVVYLEGADVEVDRAYFEEQGIQLLSIPTAIQTQETPSSPAAEGKRKRLFTPEAVEWALHKIMDTRR